MSCNEERRHKDRRRYFVYLVQSGDFDEGKALVDFFSSSGVSCTFDEPRNRDDFLGCLSEILTHARARLTKGARGAGDEIPILHLSSHGFVSDRNGSPRPSPAGFELASGEMITWANIRDTVSDLNDTCGGRLILCASTCYGIQADQIAMRVDRLDPPFFAMVANSTEVDVGDCKRAFLAFFMSLFGGDPLDGAVQAMRTASGDDNFVHHYGRATTEPFSRLMASMREGALEEVRDLYRPRWRLLR